MSSKRKIYTLDIVKKISEDLNITLKDAKTIVDAIFDYLFTTLYEDGKDVIITGKATFHVYPVRAYKIINSQNKEVRVPVQYRVRLKKSRYFKKEAKR